MTKAFLTLLSFFFFLAAQAQVATFRSIGYAISTKDPDGVVVKVKEWIIEEAHINFDLGQKEVLFLSKGMLDRDPFTVKKKITNLKEITPLTIEDGPKARVFTGADHLGKKCIIRLKPSQNEYAMSDGELQIEYPDQLEVYNLRANKYNPTVNES